MQKILAGTNFCGQATLMKIKPTKTCTHKKLAPVIMVGYPYSQKFIPAKISPTKYWDHKNFCIYSNSKNFRD